MVPMFGGGPVGAAEARHRFFIHKKEAHPQAGGKGTQTHRRERRGPKPPQTHRGLGGETFAGGAKGGPPGPLTYIHIYRDGLYSNNG